MTAAQRPISGTIITLNEEAQIAACIQSVQRVCEEVIVVDSKSTDRTREIAAEHGAKVVVQPYLGDGLQKNIGPQHARHDWVLSIDADERLTDEMVETLRALDLSSTSYEGFAVRRRNYIGSRWIKVCGWYPDYFVRLYNRKLTQWEPVKAHAKVETERYQKLGCDLIHYSYQSVGELFRKADRFSSRSAKIAFEKGKRANAFSPALHGFNAFIRKYFFKRGFMGGVDGFTVSLSAAVNSYLKYAKLLEFQRDPKARQRLEEGGLW